MIGSTSRSQLLLVAIVLSTAPLMMRAVAQQPSARSKTLQTALDRYIAAPDPNFGWKAVGELPVPEGMKATLLEMTSQKWLTEQEVERPLWKHWLTVIRPEKV